MVNNKRFGPFMERTFFEKRPILLIFSTKREGNLRKKSGFGLSFKGLENDTGIVAPKS